MRPIITSPGDPATGLGCERSIPPLFIRERITSCTPDEAVTYEVVNPSYLTFPASPGSHRGRVRFGREGGGTRVTWDVEWEPLPNAEWLSVLMVRAAIPALLGDLAKPKGGEPSSIQAILKEYGLVALLFHFTGWCTTLALVAVSLSLFGPSLPLPDALASKLSSPHSLGATIGAAVVLTETTTPARLALTVAATPAVTKAARRWGPFRAVERFVKERVAEREA